MRARLDFARSGLCLPRAGEVVPNGQDSVTLGKQAQLLSPEDGVIASRGAQLGV